MVSQTIGSLFACVAAERENKKALVYEEGARTFGQLLFHMKLMAGVLARNGIGEGSRVAILSENNPLFVEAVLAASYLGAVFVPLNTRWSLAEARAALDGVNCGALIFSETFAPTVQALADAGLCPPLLVGDGVSGGNCRVVALEEVERSRPYDGAPAKPSSKLPGALLFTGGTTGKAKGALLSHGSFVLDGAADSKDHLLYGDSSVFFSMAPLAHRAALSYLVKVLLSGGTFVMASHFDADGFLDIVEKERVTAAFIIPAPFVRKVVDAAARRGSVFPEVRVAMLGGSDVGAEEMSLVWEVFPNALVQRGYSHTENAAHTVERVSKADFDPCTFDRRRIGYPRLFTQLKLLDEEGREVEPGVVGEAYAQSPWQMIGYEFEEERCLDWIRTGDLLVENPDGSYSFKGRVKELIKSGGELVFCSEVEDVVNQMPEVLCCAAFGKPDDVYGERVCVAIVPRGESRPTLEEVQAYCVGKIAGFKKPRELVLLRELPVTGAGKVNRRVLACCESNL